MEPYQKSMLRKRGSIVSLVEPNASKKRKSETLQMSTNTSNIAVRGAQRHKTIPVSLLDISINDKVKSHKDCRNHPLCNYLHSQHKKTDNTSANSSAPQASGLTQSTLPLSSTQSQDTTQLQCELNSNQAPKCTRQSVKRKIKAINKTQRQQHSDSFRTNLRRAIVTRKQTRMLQSSCNASATHKSSQDFTVAQSRTTGKGADKLQPTSVTSPIGADEDDSVIIEASKTEMPRCCKGPSFSDSCFKENFLFKPYVEYNPLASDSCRYLTSHKTHLQGELMMATDSMNDLNSPLLYHSPSLFWKDSPKPTLLSTLSLDEDDDASIDIFTDESKSAFSKYSISEKEALMYADDPLMSVRCQYISIHLFRNVEKAKALAPVHNYFQMFSECPSSIRVSPTTRRAILTFFIEVGRSIPAPISDFSLHMAINCFDRYLSLLGQDPAAEEEKERAAQEIEAVGGACLLLCSKLEDVWTLSLSDLCRSFDEGCDNRKHDILRWELCIAARLNFEISSPTIFDFLHKMVELVKIPNYDDHTTRSLAVTSTTSRLTKAHDYVTNENLSLLESVIGCEQLGWSSPSYFRQMYKVSRHEDLSSQDLSQLFALAAATGELVLFHHTALGIPTHLIAAASFTLALSHTYGRSKEHMPQAMWSILGKDYAQLKEALSLVSVILEERAVMYCPLGQTPKNSDANDSKKNNRHSFYSMTTASSYHISPHPDNLEEIADGGPRKAKASSPLSRLLMLLPAAAPTN